jgi:hypothetical protein
MHLKAITSLMNAGEFLNTLEIVCPEKYYVKPHLRRILIEILEGQVIKLCPIHYNFSNKQTLNIR